MRSVHDLRALVEIQERIADRLVLLEGIETTEFARGHRALRRSLLVDHPRVAGPELERLRLQDGALGSRASLLLGEHERFRQSLEQLAWLRGIVDQEDHGGHRQALGQYWRLVLEALRHHLDDEASLLASA